MWLSADEIVCNPLDLIRGTLRKHQAATSGSWGSARQLIIASLMSIPGQAAFLLQDADDRAAIRKAYKRMAMKW